MVAGRQRYDRSPMNKQEGVGHEDESGLLAPKRDYRRFDFNVTADTGHDRLYRRRSGSGFERAEEICSPAGRRVWVEHDCHASSEVGRCGLMERNKKRPRGFGPRARAALPYGSLRVSGAVYPMRAAGNNHSVVGRPKLNLSNGHVEPEQILIFGCQERRSQPADRRAAHVVVRLLCTPT